MPFCCFSLCFAFPHHLFEMNMSCAVHLGSWRSYKLLLSVVESAILKKSPEAYYDLDGVLRRFKSELLSPLRNPVNIFLVMIILGSLYDRKVKSFSCKEGEVQMIMYMYIDSQSMIHPVLHLVCQ